MNILIYDIETAPTEAFVWKMWKENITPGQIINPGRPICWAAKWLGEREVFFASEWGEPDTFVKSLHALMEEADAVCTYNGNNFDEPVMNAAFLKLGLAPPAPSKSIDLYQVVRKEFRLLSNRMDYVAEFLGEQGKLETGGFSLWRDVVLFGDPKARVTMEKYNKRDIKVLEKLYKRIRPWIKNHPSLGHFGGDAHSCPTCGSKKLQRRGTHKTKVSTFQRFQCQSCGAWSRYRIAEKTEPKPEIVTL